MKKDQKFCINHQDRLTFHRCFVCHKPICTACRLQRSHHYFCGIWCWMKFKIGVYTVSVKNFFKRRRFLFSPWTVVIIFLIVLVWMTINLKKLHSRLGDMENRMLSSSALNPGTNHDSMDMKIISPARSKGMIYKNHITISGEADDNSVVMLLNGSKLLRSVQPKDGMFTFENVKLNRGDNELFVQMVSPTGERTGLETLNFRYNSPTLNYLARSLYRGNPEIPVISLTFDGGYLDNVSGEILDYLNELKIKATFFLTGKFVKMYPETVRRIVAEGHEVGNHTMNHPHLTTFSENRRHDTAPGITRQRLQEELQEMAALFYQVTGNKISNIWRAPYGEQNPEICSWAAELGYRQIGWTMGHGNGENMDAMDWISNPKQSSYLTAEQVKNKIIRFANNGENGAAGAIILMHLGSERDSDFPHRKIPEIVTELRQLGYRFVTISEMSQESFD